MPLLLYEPLPALTLTKRDFSTVKKLSVNASRDVVTHAFDSAKDVEDRPGHLSSGNIAGRRLHCPERTCGDHPVGRRGRPSTARALDDIAKYLDGVADGERVRAWASGHCSGVFDVDQWIDAVRNYDFVFGNRFHGT